MTLVCMRYFGLMFLDGGDGQCVVENNSPAGTLVRAWAVVTGCPLEFCRQLFPCLAEAVGRVAADADDGQERGDE